MGTYKVDICGVNTSKPPIPSKGSLDLSRDAWQLKEAEKEELFKKIKAGDMDARETYIQAIFVSSSPSSVALATTTKTSMTYSKSAASD